MELNSWEKTAKPRGFPLKLNGVNSNEENMVTEEGKSKQNTKMNITCLQNRNDQSSKTLDFNTKK